MSKEYKKSWIEKVGRGRQEMRERMALKLQEQQRIREGVDAIKATQKAGQYMTDYHVIWGNLNNISNQDFKGFVDIPTPENVKSTENIQSEEPGLTVGYEEVRMKPSVKSRRSGTPPIQWVTEAISTLYGSKHSTPIPISNDPIDPYQDLIAKAFERYRIENSPRNLIKLFKAIDYPEPWPTSEEILGIEYIDGKIYVTTDESEPEDFRDTSNFDPEPGYRIQSPGRSVGSITIDSDSEFGRRNLRLHQKPRPSTKRSFRSDRS